MNKILSILLACTAAGAAYGAQETAQETGQAAKNVAIDSVVVTGARYASDIRHLPMSVAVVDRDEIVRRQEASVLPLLTEQVPGLFVTGRGVMGYGVSDGAAGGISLRGIGGGSAAQMLVLIDGASAIHGGCSAIRSPTPTSRCSPSGSRWCADRRRCSTARTPWAG